MEYIKTAIKDISKNCSDESSKAERIAAIKRLGGMIQELAHLSGCHQIWDLHDLIKRQERQHRKGGYGRYSESVETAAAYFMVRTLAHAADTVGRSGKEITRRLSGVLADYLMAFSIYAAHRDTFRAVGLTRARLEGFASLVDYAQDIA